MNRLQTALTRIFAVLLTLAFCLLAGLCLWGGSPLQALVPAAVAALTALAGAGCLLALLLTEHLRGRLRHPRRVYALLLAAGLAVYFLLQLYFAGHLITNGVKSWDFGIVADAAMDAARGGSVSEAYFRMWSNNIPLLLLLTGVFRLAAALGAADFNLIGIGLNLFAIDLSILLCARCLRRATGRRAAALLGAALLCATLPLLTYSAIYYTDTLTLPFPIGVLLLWLEAKTALRAGRRQRGLLLLGLAAAVAALGALLKITVLFVLIAVVIDALLSFAPRRGAACLCAAVLLFSAVYFPLQRAGQHSPLLVADSTGSSDYYIPFTHWIMMGLYGNGGYRDEDYQLTLSVPGSERQALVAAEIQSRLRAYGFCGLLRHLRDKCVYVWADGTYYAAVAADRDRVSSAGIDRFVLASADRFAVTAYPCQALLLLNELCLAAAGALLWRKNHSALLLPAGISLFGLFLFECLWEARSRYLLNYLPVFVAVTVTVLCALVSRLRRRA